MNGFGHNESRPCSRRRSKLASTLMQKAVALHKSGRLSDAEQLYIRALDSGLHHEALFSNLGVIYKSTNRYDLAIDIYERAISLNPGFADAYANLGNLLLELGQADRALTMTLKSIELDPSLANAYVILSYIYRQKGLLADALSAAHKAIRLDPQLAEGFVSVGIILQEECNYEDALVATQKAAILNPRLFEAHINLAIIYKSQGRLSQALTCVIRSLELRPDSLDANIIAADLHKEEGKYDQASEYARRAITSNPQSGDAYLSLAIIYKEQGLLDKAREACSKSISLNPDLSAAHLNLGIILKQQGLLDEALSSVQTALELAPDCPKTLCAIGVIQQSLGALRIARQYLNASLRREPVNASAIYALSRDIETADHARSLLQQARHIHRDRLMPADSSMLDFALSNCYHKIGDFAESAKYLSAANCTKLILKPSEACLYLKSIANCSAIGGGLSVDTEDDGRGRIFIVGMPRCGSTLLETVLSINPCIVDLGETPAMPHAIAKYMHIGKGADCSVSLSQLYDSFTQTTTASAEYTTDKNLYNFQFCSIIASALPAAKIIHCVRYPLDNILSMFRANLMTGNNYTSDLSDASYLYIAQHEVMRECKESFPASVYTFEYDSFVRAPRETLGPLLDWLGLEWSDAYLCPEKNTRRINTASAIQSRRPIYRSSLSGWRKYAEMLEPARKILSEGGLV